MIHPCAACTTHLSRHNGFLSGQAFDGYPVRSRNAMDKRFLQTSLKLAAAVLLYTLLIPPTALLADGADALGSRERSPGTLIATFYDLTQTQNRKPTNLSSVPAYSEICSEFLKDDWNEAVMNRYFRVTQPLYATQIYFPLTPCEAVPKAFGIENIVKGYYWMVHYKGQVSPPETGRYRFAGYADNWMAVAINGQTVLIAARTSTPVTIPSFKWTAERKGYELLNGRFTYGDWIDLKKGVPVDLDVAFGETVGGVSGAVLVVQKEGETYEKTEEGFPILPLFQLTEKMTVAPKRGSSPAFCLGKPWTGIE